MSFSGDLTVDGAHIRWPIGVRWTELRRMVGLIVMLMLTPGQVLAVGENLSFETLISEAKQARKNNEPERAAEYLRRAYRVKPMPVLLNNLGKVYEELGWYSEAYEAYTRVTDDPNAPNELRTLDETRVAKLAPKLGQAWIRCPRDLGWSALWVDGEPYPLESGVEVAVDPGFTQFEIQRETSKSVLLRLVKTSAGRRFEVSPTLGTASVEHGRINLRGIKGLVLRITIDGYEIKARASMIKDIKVPGGEHLLQIELANERPQSFRVFVPSGGSIKLRDYLKSDQGQANKPSSAVRATSGDSLMIYVSMGLSVSILSLGVMEIVAATDGFAQLRSDMDLQEDMVNKARMDGADSPAQDLNSMLEGLYNQRQAYRDFNTHSDTMKMGTILTTLGGVGFASSLVWLTLSEVRANQSQGSTWTPSLLPVVWRRDDDTHFGLRGHF